MKLTRLVIHNYRSIWSGDQPAPLTLEFGEGLNTLIGPNNCGKSNVLGALRLALDETATFDPERDFPKPMAWSYARIQADFAIDPNTSGPEQTLLRYLEEYESDAGARKTNASQGRLSLLTQFRPPRPGGEVRAERRILVGGRGSILGDARLHDRALKQLRRCLRFIYIRSGQSLEGLLVGGIREILRSVLRENLAEEFSQAEAKRAAYVQDLREGLLVQLTNQLNEELAEVFPEVKGVTITPQVPSIEDTLAAARIELEDHAVTAMEDKGTGLRGTLLVAMLKYLALHSRRSVVFAVEEPESFLHPAAQETLRDDLESLCARPDVTLVVTTHSPFLVSRRDGAKSFSLQKDQTGRTRLAAAASADEDLDRVLTPLFRASAIPHFLSRASRIPPDTQLALVVEGSTDEEYIRMACAKAGRLDLLAGLHIETGHGAEGAALQGIALRQMVEGSIPVCVLLDFDQPGRNARDLLVQRFHFQNRKEVRTYQEWVDDGGRDVEAEDLFPDFLLEAFVRENGDEILAEKARRHRGGWHWGFTEVGKERLPTFLEERAGAADVAAWVRLLEDIRTRLGVPALAI